MRNLVSLLLILGFSSHLYAMPFDRERSERLRDLVCQFSLTNLEEIQTLIGDPLVDVNNKYDLSPILCVARVVPKEFQFTILSALISRSDLNLDFPSLKNGNALTYLLKRYGMRS